MTKITINTTRLLEDLHQLRTFGTCGNGVIRPAYSDTDIAARKWLAVKIAEAGLIPFFDPIGNLFGLPPDDKPCLLIGSHADTQPEGGWLDGAYGVIVGLEIARAAMEGTGTKKVAVVAFQDEESRFGALTGSRVWAGGLPLAEADRLIDHTGTTMFEARQRMHGLCSGYFLPTNRFTGFLEAHIEQGPVLDNGSECIGVVNSIVGIRNEKYRFLGQQNHAGTTPMHLRKDAFQGMVKFTSMVNKRLEEVVTPETVWTIGHVKLHPNASSIVPGQVDFSVQWRDGDEDRLNKMTEIIRSSASESAKLFGLKMERFSYNAIPPSHMTPTLISTIEASAKQLAPNRWRHMSSGALHDTANLSPVMPVGMLLVPSIGGISHDFAEDTMEEHLILGAQILAKCCEG